MHVSSLWKSIDNMSHPSFSLNELLCLFHDKHIAPAVHKLSFASPVTLFPSFAPKLWIISIHGSYDLSSTFNSISMRCLHFQLLAYISRIFIGKHYMHFLYFCALFFLSGRLWSKLAIPSYRFFFFSCFLPPFVLHRVASHLHTSKNAYLWSSRTRSSARTNYVILARKMYGSSVKM